jgi:pimeloyl-ACP methyl ester carboxylesterase
MNGKYKEFIFDPHYEDPDPCQIRHRCRDDKCKEDIYFIGGWDRTQPITYLGIGQSRFDDHIRDLFEKHDIYICENIPTYEHRHDADKDARIIADEIKKKSDDSVSVIGDSYGGMVAQKVASRLPEKVDKLALLFTIASGNKTPKWIDELIGFTDDDISHLTSRVLATRIGQYVFDGIPQNEGVGRGEDVANFFSFDATESNGQIDADVFSLNCLADRWMGKFISVDVVDEMHIRFPCFHHRLWERDVRDIAEFLNR